MTKTVRCPNCSLVAAKQGFGFTGIGSLYCTKFEMVVEETDGCTFGTRGIPQYAVDDITVTIDNRAAVNGWTW